MTPRPTPRPPDAAPDIINENGRFYADHFGEYVPCRRKGIASKSLWDRTDRRKVSAPQAPGMPSELLKAPRYDRGGAYVLVEDYDALRAEAKRLKEENSDWLDAQRDLYEINAILAQRIERLEAELEQARGQREIDSCATDNERGIRLVGPHGGLKEKLPNPSGYDLADPLFEVIWQATKTWEVNAPEYYKGYCRMNGSHVMLILNAIRALQAKQENP